MAKEEELQYLCEARDERMISPKNGKSTVRIARFLKPCVRSVNQAVKIPNIPLLSETFSHNSQEWPSKVLFKVPFPQRNWAEWIDKLAGKYAYIWNQTGICDAIMSSRYEIRLNHDVILGLTEFWCPETNTFVFPWGEATITLEDVMVHGGLPTLGVPVTSSLTGELVKLDEAMNIQRMEMSRRNKAKKAAHSDWMKHNMEKEGGSELEHVAFLSLWLTRYVFPSPPENTVKKNVFPIAAHLSRGTKMALGPAVLASLYRQLSWLKKKAASLQEPIILTVTGSFQLVQLWAFERFPLLEPNSLNLLKPGEPRIARWHKLKSTVNLPLVRWVVRSAENFKWRPYAADVNNWRHLAYYKETEQILFDCSSLDDQELLSSVLCMRASELVGLDCTEKYMPHRVAMQFGMDQDLPGDPSGFGFTLENLCLFVPPRSFEAGVSQKYFNWWKESLLAREDAVKEVLKQGRDQTSSESFSWLFGTNKNKAFHASDAVKEVSSSLKADNEVRHALTTTASPSKIKMEKLLGSSDGESDDVHIPISFRKTNRLNVFPSNQSQKVVSPVTNKEVPSKLKADSEHVSTTPASPSTIKMEKLLGSSDGESDDEHIPISFRARRKNLLYDCPSNKSQKVVSPVTSDAAENSRKRKLPTKTEEIIRSVNEVAKEAERKTSDSANHLNKVNKNVNAGDAANNPINIVEERKVNDQGKGFNGSVNGAAGEGKGANDGGCFNNPIDVDDYMEATQSKIPKLGSELEDRLQKLEKLLGVIPK